VDVGAAMARAVALGRAGLGSTSPNPSVGCVVLDVDGQPVGEGATQPPPGRHAEVVALTQAGTAALGGTVVVTLEPCAHTGRTGPCTEALRRSGIARVVFAEPDPDPLATGGAQALRDAGIIAQRSGAAAYLHPWLSATRLGRPYVTWKYAATLDGRSAAPDGTSRWITGEAARAEAHQLRAEVDAIVAGSGTVLADDPQLTARSPDGMPLARQPLRVVVDPSRRVPPTARALDAAGPSLLVHDRDPRTVLAHLHDRGARHVLLEGGPTLAGGWLEAGVVDEVRGYVAPALLGAGATAVDLPSTKSIGDALRLLLVDVHRVGDDVRITLRTDRGDS